MSITTKHQCPSCGGYLNVDNDKQMYRCASCGSTYDFDYFREEKLLAAQEEASLPVEMTGDQDDEDDFADEEVLEETAENEEEEAEA